MGGNGNLLSSVEGAIKKWEPFSACNQLSRLPGKKILSKIFKKGGGGRGGEWGENGKGKLSTPFIRKNRKSRERRIYLGSRDEWFGFFLLLLPLPQLGKILINFPDQKRS